MEDNEDFVDLYALLQVRSTCDNAMLDKAFRHFAQQYHPDHSETADIDKFQQVLDAYRLLKNPESRAAYDTEYNSYYKSEENYYPKFYDAISKWFSVSDISHVWYYNVSYVNFWHF